MKKVFLKALASVLAVAVMFSSVAVLSVAAADGNCDCEHCPSIVIPGIFQSRVRYLDENGNEMLNEDGEPYSAPFFMKSTGDIVKKALEEALIPLAGLLLTQTDIDSRCANAVAEVLGDALLSNIALDENGRVIKNIKADKYDTNISNDALFLYALPPLLLYRLAQFRNRNFGTYRHPHSLPALKHKSTVSKTKHKHKEL